jgi:hypothetical protein
MGKCCMISMIPIMIRSKTMYVYFKSSDDSQGLLTSTDESEVQVHNHTPQDKERPRAATGGPGTKIGFQTLVKGAN